MNNNNNNVLVMRIKKAERRLKRCKDDLKTYFNLIDVNLHFKVLMRITNIFMEVKILDATGFPELTTTHRLDDVDTYYSDEQPKLMEWLNKNKNKWIGIKDCG